ncbi:MAG: malonyl-CoA decarboxylase [Betaproteobacteria bacterium]
MFDSLISSAQRTKSQRAIRHLLADCRRLLSERGQANSVAIASALAAKLAELDRIGQRLFFDRLAAELSPDPAAVLARAQDYAREPTAAHLIALTQAAEPPRQELLRRINGAPGGTATIVQLRSALLEHLRANPDLQAVDADLLHLLSSWFNPGFLELRRVDWNSPAQLLEELIRHEAVHAIDGWNDLRRRLQPDRRCFAFFHPQLPGRPLIFVEVALLAKMPEAIAPLIDQHAAPLPPETYKVAAFYSISNCEPGLRGVSLGNFLIKRVAEELKRELPKLATFCTLSPIPGFINWLSGDSVEADLSAQTALKPARRAALINAHALLVRGCDGDVRTLAGPGALERLDALDRSAQEALLGLCAAYLTLLAPGPAGDPVARFHLDNGARLERLNARADLSKNGMRQSAGMMVNYLYDLARIEANHAQFKNGVAVHSRAIAANF